MVQNTRLTKKLNLTYMPAADVIAIGTSHASVGGSSIASLRSKPKARMSQQSLKKPHQDANVTATGHRPWQASSSIFSSPAPCGCSTRNLRCNILSRSSLVEEKVCRSLCKCIMLPLSLAHDSTSSPENLHTHTRTQRKANTIANIDA